VTEISVVHRSPFFGHRCTFVARAETFG